MLQEPSIMTLILIIIIWLKKPKYQPFPFFPIDSQQATNQSPNHNSVIINPRVFCVAWAPIFVHAPTCSTLYQLADVDFSTLSP